MAAAEKQKVCKNCGYMTTANECPLCKSTSFADKPKGKIIIFDAQNSVVAEKAGIKNNGSFAIKYN